MPLPEPQRKQIALNFLKQAHENHPEWDLPHYIAGLPAPVYPVKLSNVNLADKRMANLPLTEIEKSVLCGTIIGDSSFCVDSSYKNARYQQRHTTRSYDWFIWKNFVVLKRFNNVTGLIFQDTDGYQANAPLRPGEEILGKLKITSKVHKDLTALHSIVCVNNRKKIQRFWLNHMNTYFLMTVWLDDGSLYNGRQGTICFNSVPADEQQIFREYLLAVWNIHTAETKIGIMKNGQPNVRIDISDINSLLTLLRLIAPLVPVRSMLYKLCFVPKDNVNLLERWKAELIELVRPEFRKDIEDFYQNL